MTFFEQAINAIARAYDDLGHAMGWRFLTSPRAMLAATTEIALITLNPGGDRDRPDHGRESCEHGSAYLTETWKNGLPPGEAPLQRQIRALFDMIAEETADERGGDTLLAESLTAQFVPFRSPSWETLHRRSASLAFARDLWSGVFEEINPRLIITIDTQTARELGSILIARHGEAVRRARYTVGWGRIAAGLQHFGRGSDSCALLRLPHLSRFRVFGRQASAAPLRTIIRSAVEHLV